MLISLRDLKSRLLALCFQSRCVGCRRWASQPVCFACSAAFPVFPADTCPRCRGTVLPCPLCTSESPLTAIYAAGPYHGVLREALHGLKFEARRDLARWLGARMRLALPALDSGWIVIPVPLSPERLRQRGYNQADWLAREIRGFPQRPRWLMRVKHTASQVGRSRRDRWQSLEQAFAASSRVAGQRILLVDDVLTTGATLYWAAKALEARGAVEIRALVAGRTPLLRGSGED